MTASDAARGGVETSEAGGRAGSGESGARVTDPAAAGGRDASEAPDREGAAATAGSGEGGEPASPDTAPPEILSVSPPDGAVGVRADTDVVVTFSEAMNEAATEDALTSPDLPQNLVFAWNQAGTILTVHLGDLLQYRPIAGPTPVVYHFSLSGHVSDLAGNHLPETHSYSFQTAELAQAALSPVDIRHIQHLPAGQDQVQDYCPASAPIIRPKSGVLFTFSLAQIDALEHIVDVPAAELTVQYSQTGGVLAEQLGADWVTVEPSRLAWNPPILGDLGSFELAPDSGDMGTIQLGVSSAVVEDIAERNDRMSRSQFFVRDVSDASTYTANLSCDSALLRVTYALNPN